MATFYSEIQGNRGRATRCGSKGSGIVANASTWGNILEVRQFENETNQSGYGASIQLTGGLSSGQGTKLYVTFDANNVVRQSEDEGVKKALQDVADAFDALNVAANMAAGMEKLRDQVAA